MSLGIDTGRPWELTGEKLSEFEARKLREQFYRKSQYPPMVIEPFPTLRSRVLKMTPEDRARRARWEKDQIVHPEDKQVVPRPRNFFRRIYHKPLDFVFKALQPILVRKVKFMINIKTINVDLHNNYDYELPTGTVVDYCRRHLFWFPFFGFFSMKSCTCTDPLNLNISQ